MPELKVNLEFSTARIDGESRNQYSARLCAGAAARNDGDANALLQQITLTHQTGMLRLVSPSSSTESHTSADLQIQAPSDVPLAVEGKYAAIAVRGISAPVKLSTTHARITVVDPGGDVEATATEFGIVDFSGVRGNIRLSAATEINVNVPDAAFRGTLSAVAERSVRVLLHPGFATPFEAVVNRERDFICRADIRGKFRRSMRNGNVVFRYGSGEPLLHFRSISGPVVIDSADRLPDRY